MDQPKVKELELEPGIQGVRLSNDQFSVTVAPQLGGKLVSLIHRKTRREFLSRTKIAYRPRTYGDPFEDYERDGADECFPGIEESPYPSFPWQGASVPCHGEVWTLPWEYQVRQGKLHMWAHGVRFPYVLERRIHFEILARQEKPYIRFSYRVQNQSPYQYRRQLCVIIIAQSSYVGRNELNYIGSGFS